MAVTLKTIYEASQPNGELAGRVEGAFVKACWAVVYEGTAVEDHAVRIAFAKKVLQLPRTYVKQFYRLIISDGIVQDGLGNTTTIEDPAVEAAVNGFWTIMANVEAS